jgi:transposase
MAQGSRVKQPRKRRVAGGVDTHADTHHAAVVLMNGRRLADAQFPATADGYAQLLAWLRSFGRVHAVGVEGTGCYGAGLARHLTSAKVRVVEVDRPDRRQRRVKGKSDPLDAYAAAEAVLAGRATTVPKTANGIIEAIRAVHTVRAGAIKARTACMNELRALLVTAPADLRDQLRGLGTVRLVTACADLHTNPADLHPADLHPADLHPADLHPADPDQAIGYALRHLADRWHTLTQEIHQHDRHLTALIHHTRPDLLAIRGVGVETAAQLLTTVGDNPDRLHSEAAFAALCGAAPVPASSGKTTRHRLSRGGDRQANRALHLITLTRIAHDPATRTYLQRRTAQGKTKREIIRCLKRYIARQLYKIITNPHPAAAP